MPEGDTVYRTARHLDGMLAGRVLTSSDFRVPQYATVDLAGKTVDAVVSRGKHLLIRVGEVSIHSHLKMEGSWHLYRTGSVWRRPAFTARAVLATEEWLAVGFDLGTLDIVPRDQEQSLVGYLGPDLLGPDWNEEEAVARLGARPERPIHVALLDQRNLAGLGNVYANEVCFLRGLSPWRPVGEVGQSGEVDEGKVDEGNIDEGNALRQTVALSQRLITANRDRTERSTTGDLRPGRRSWVYRREHKPCLRCGTRILHDSLGADELSLRDVYWCPHCQR